MYASNICWMKCWFGVRLHESLRETSSHRVIIIIPNSIVPSWQLALGKYIPTLHSGWHENCALSCVGMADIIHLFIIAARLGSMSRRYTHCQHLFHKFTTHLITTRHKRILLCFNFLLWKYGMLLILAHTQLTHISKYSRDKNFNGIRDATSRRISAVRQPHSIISYIPTGTHWSSGAHSFM